MTSTIDHYVKQQLLGRRHKLEHAAAKSSKPEQIFRLLDEIDQALSRMDDGSFGVCETCHDSIEQERLICDPLVRFCLDHLNRRERDALQEDLELAARVQRGLLPRSTLDWKGWHICYHYEPAGVVSGDYCDVIDAGDSGLYFMVGDVSGKGVAASMLMAHLHAMFRALIPFELSLRCMLEHANRVFSESTLPSQYATLVGGRALPDGRVEIYNAGHPFPLVVRGGEVNTLPDSNLPLGMFGEEEFTISRLQLGPGDGLVIYSDGVPEAMNNSGNEYGISRITDLITGRGGQDLSAVVAACREDLSAFRQNAMRTDDVTLFVLSRGKSIGLRPPVQQIETYASAV
ncbi:MAG: SpoIIE family protein phosphatase [Acidobacteriaceae bacterium]|nr:SpoIIE family protein phosphatase [Acidobacteriaceae bacterium]